MYHFSYQGNIPVVFEEQIQKSIEYFSQMTKDDFKNINFTPLIIYKALLYLEPQPDLINEDLKVKVQIIK